MSALLPANIFAELILPFHLSITLPIITQGCQRDPGHDRFQMAARKRAANDFPHFSKEVCAQKVSKGKAYLKGAQGTVR